MRDVTYTLTCEPEDTPIRGNASAWGTEKQECDVCLGCGTVPGGYAHVNPNDLDDCPKCGGDGYNVVDLDAELEREIIAQLDAGNDWAWCTVKVTARYRDMVGVAYLGCCSYEGPADFIAHSDYYDDLKDEALADLELQIDDARRTVAAWDGAE